ncbi:hypothetical protein GOB93_02475 [Acetobacter musti]|uniref:Lipoprotein n=1 Tax=Acetobacter musti TaxID=864732 RepID=A0ABX0JJG2_9PROT|nr:hypothetical protein [Acetobacter musti]
MKKILTLTLAAGLALSVSACMGPPHHHDCDRYDRGQRGGPMGGGQSGFGNGGGNGGMGMGRGPGGGGGY